MTKIKRRLFYAGVLALVVIAPFVFKPGRRSSAETPQEIKPVTGSIRAVITSTATVQPQNRLEIKPPINGRIDKILVKEGDMVKAGQTIALMSSTERAALLDAARSHGPEEMKYWEDVYKPTPLISPIDGEVIVSTDEPGQTVTNAEPVVVISDYLIVQAQVDETDIGKVRAGREAVITLDAYPEIKVTGKVDHIYYESQVVNNVTIYKVDILPDDLPDIFRSGMSATVDITETVKDNVLTLPIAAIERDGEGAYVVLKNGGAKNGIRRKVETGAADDKNIEILSGLGAGDTVLLVNRQYRAPGAVRTGSNPLMPALRRRKQAGG